MRRILIVCLYTIYSAYLYYAASIVNIIMWSGIEACASTTCANLPCYGAVLGKASKLKPIFSSIISKLTKGTNSTFRFKQKEWPSQQISASAENIVAWPRGVETRIAGPCEGDRTTTEVEMGRIQVQTRLDSTE